MKFKKTSVLSAVALGALLSGGVYGVSVADAKGFGSGDHDPANRPETRQYANRVTADERAAHQAERQGSLVLKLDESVSSGAITAEQKTLILEKHAEIRAEREGSLDAWRELTREERQAKIAERRATLEQWAEDNGIDMKYFGGPEGSHSPEGKGGPRGGSGFGNGRDS